ncbi:hypothetical protein RB597_003313 [Gaeumannomyces tritici]
MTAVIEALHIYDERKPIHSSPVLSHTYTGRPLSAAHLLPLYLEHPPPRPSLIYLPNASPATLVFSLAHANLLFLATASREVEPLLVLEFLHRVVDAFEEFLGAPLTAQRIDSAYDVAAQLLTEMCDAGVVATTEPNALRDLVEVEGLLGKLLGGLTLPGAVAANLGGGGGPSGPSLGSGGMMGVGGGGGGRGNVVATPALPWRRANVRHTSNEMYADLVETLSVTLAPSGRPLAAFAHGTVAFTSKVSGVPDIVMSLTGPTGRHNLAGLMELPVFHPCVRLARWRERPGELSFIPPDGRFILASYEVILPPLTSGKSGSLVAGNLKLPANIEVKTGLGPTGCDFEVRVYVNKVFGASGGGGGSDISGGGGSYGRGGGGRGIGGGPVGRPFGGPQPGTAAAPLLEDLRITVPLPAGVRNLPELRPSKGDATYSPGDNLVDWLIPNKALASGTMQFSLRGTVVGDQALDDADDAVAAAGYSDLTGFGFKEYNYEDPEPAAAAAKPAKGASGGGGGDDEKTDARVAQNKLLMPSSASLSFSVKGWLPSGIKVESILIDQKRSMGLTASPYKGVKYLTVSKGGVELRC